MSDGPNDATRYENELQKQLDRIRKDEELNKLKLEIDELRWNFELEKEKFDKRNEQLFQRIKKLYCEKFAEWSWNFKNWGKYD